MDYPQYSYNPGVEPDTGKGLAAGISQAGQAFGGAIEKHELDLQRDSANEVIFQQALDSGEINPQVLGYKAGERPSPAEMYAKFKGATRNQQNGWVTGLIGNYMGKLNEQNAQIREHYARTNYYQAEAEATREYGGKSGLKGKVWSPELGGWATPPQADAARRRTPQGYLKQAYGLTPEQIFDSKQHEGGTVTIDPTTGAKKFTNDPAGDQIRIGGESGIVMPKAEHEVYKRQLQMEGGVPVTAQGAAGGTAGGAAPGTVRVRSPQGVVGTIPANRLEEAISAGYTAL